MASLLVEFEAGKLADGVEKEKTGRSEEEDDEGVAETRRLSLISHLEKGRASTLASARIIFSSSVLKKFLKMSCKKILH